MDAETNGDGNADLSILVSSDHALTASAFVGLSPPAGALHAPDAPADVVAGLEPLVPVFSSRRSAHPADRDLTRSAF